MADAEVYGASDALSLYRNKTKFFKIQLHSEKPILGAVMVIVSPLALLR
ncbi:hypothetical protein TOT_020000452 [Theileria orientalis strain Shintoku]|uniref:Uncharacterized protein n=1 Tax=Theileria orientalis strain Shintoku TaxID=869250 RepID=J4D7H5_THEOR|nr:hypothetical protein TOT_020000452 [Theileria orientalis strain Shintoku]BAM40190.1 hypothetical protein TOT_020000452 [Theileria orientalis strain Shintoku]|eukprot:XP_009690491.1 hypothetical protein TOT_020000452 [Theileria orientalis strain Shintoku]